MFQDKITIKQRINESLVNKHGDNLSRKLQKLSLQLARKDTFVDNNLDLRMQNLLNLDLDTAEYFVDLALELSTASSFAPVLLLEKIPTLMFYGLVYEIGEFLRNVKDYGVRSISLYLGSDHLKTDDLIDVLQQSNVNYYKALLYAVNQQHREFGVVCTTIMINAAQIRKVVQEDEIPLFLENVLYICRHYRSENAIRYVSNIVPISEHVPLKKHIKDFNIIAKKSIFNLEFSLVNPRQYFNATHHEYKAIDVSVQNLRNTILYVLCNEAYQVAFEYSCLFADCNFKALFMFWPKASAAFKQNVIFQLSKHDYCAYVVNDIQVAKEFELINKATNCKWFSQWMFCGEEINDNYIRKYIRKIMQSPEIFSVPPKQIVGANKELFNRNDSNYNTQRLHGILSVLIDCCNDGQHLHMLSCMRSFISGNGNDLKDALSKDEIVIKAWSRDPWNDYGTADELFSCTAIGQYAADNTPCFLADLNLVHLDVWSNKSRVGRIHLCLVKDVSDEPLLLLDCVDGSERMLESKSKFNSIMAAIIEYTKYLGLHRLKINFEVDFNTTPKKFICSVEDSMTHSVSVDFLSRFLPPNSDSQLIPYPSQTFMESFIKYSSAYVKGPIFIIERDDSPIELEYKHEVQIA